MSEGGQEHKITVLGSGGVGKSTLTIRLITNNFVEEYDPTIEDSYRKQCYIDNKIALLDILDTAGQEEYGSMQDHWMRVGKGFLLIYDITEMSTFREIVRFKEKLTRAKDMEIEDLPVVLVGNKCDLEDQRQVPRSEGEDLAKMWGGVPFFETSAKTNLNATEAFYEVVRRIRKLDAPAEEEEAAASSFSFGSFAGMSCNVL